MLQIGNTTHNIYVAVMQCSELEINTHKVYEAVHRSFKIMVPIYVEYVAVIWYNKLEVLTHKAHVAAIRYL